MNCCLFILHIFFVLKGKILLVRTIGDSFTFYSAAWSAAVLEGIANNTIGKDAHTIIKKYVPSQNVSCMDRFSFYFQCSLPDHLGVYFFFKRSNRIQFSCHVFVCWYWESGFQRGWSKRPDYPCSRYDAANSFETTVWYGGSLLNPGPYSVIGDMDN